MHSSLLQLGRRTALGSRQRSDSVAILVLDGISHGIRFELRKFVAAELAVVR